MRWQVRLDDVPVDEVRLYLVFEAPVARRAVATEAKRRLTKQENLLAGLVNEFGFETSKAAYVDIDMGALLGRLVEDMDANPTDKRFKVRFGDGILFGLISIHEAMGKPKKARAAARRFLALMDGDPKLARSYAKHIAFARGRL